MNDQHSDSLETQLRKFRIREAEIAKEFRDDIAEMQDDLTRIVGEFTSVLTQKTETEVTFTSSRISDVELQLRRLEETKSMISSFAGIFQQFNSMTSKILAADANLTHRQPSSHVKAAFVTQTAEHGVETALLPNLHDRRRAERSLYSSDDDEGSRGDHQRHAGSGIGDDESDMVVNSAGRLTEISSKKRNYLDVSDPDRVNITGQQICLIDAKLKE